MSSAAAGLPALRSDTALPALVSAGDRARIRFLEFFATNIRNRHTPEFWGEVQPLRH